jgi:hypothetical protein
MHQWGQSHGVREESLGAVTATSTSTVLTAGASANTKGSWVQLGTSAPVNFASNYMIVHIGKSGGATLSDFTVDIGLGSTQFVLVPDLHFPGLKGVVGSEIITIEMPLHIPKATAIYARCAATTASMTCQIGVHLFSQGFMGMPGFSRVDCLGAIATSRGVAVDCGASANTKTRVQIVASTARRYGGMFCIIGPNADVSRTVLASALMDISVGASSSEYNILSNHQLTWSTTYDVPWPWVIPAFPCDIPAASRVSVNAQCSDATAGDRAFDVCLYGLVP